MSTLEFAEHLNKLKPQLIGYALKLTANDHDAQDLYQETAFRAIKHRDHFQPGTNLAGWLLTIMRNIFINQYRRKKRRATLLDHSDNQFLLQPSEYSGHNEGEIKVLYDDLKSVIDKLDDSMRKPFLMHFSGYKYEEIAEDMDLPLGTIKSRIFFARKYLKEYLSKTYGEIHLG